MRSVAAPVRDARGDAVAAINVSTTVAQTDVAQIHDEILPALLRTADRVTEALARR